jgi:hypothetical protein
MKEAINLILLFVTCLPIYAQKKSKEKLYYPPLQSWQHLKPTQLGLDEKAIQLGIEFAKSHEVVASREGSMAQFQSFGKEPFSEPVGPLKDRGEPTGLILYKGYIIAQWGEPNRVDMTHSVTKSLLSTIIGVAVDKKLINSAMDTVATYMPPVELYNPHTTLTELIYPFDTPHNRKLTWDVMLRQTSDWEGTLWGKADWADRPEGDISTWKTRTRHEPGSVWKYNDVRVNALALAATCVWRRPLPEVLKEQIMDPIGASNTWRWTGYYNSWIVVDGRPVQSVSGGGHWGGGLFINAFDMARFGLLTLRYGNWEGKQLISRQWVNQALTPTTANPGYGYMNWFLNTNKKLMPSAPENAWVHIGNGTNMIYCDPDHDLVIVARWIDSKAMDGLVKAVLSAWPNGK